MVPAALARAVFRRTRRRTGRWRQCLADLRGGHVQKVSADHAQYLRTCEIIRKSRERAEKAGWQGAREGASPLRVDSPASRRVSPFGLPCGSLPRGLPAAGCVTERATPPDGLFCSRPRWGWGPRLPTWGCVSFWLGLRCSGGAADPATAGETVCRRQPRGRCEALATPQGVLPPPSPHGQAKNPQQPGIFVIISQVLTKEREPCFKRWRLRGAFGGLGKIASQGH